MNEYLPQKAGIGRRVTAGLVDLLIALFLFPIILIFIFFFFLTLSFIVPHSSNEYGMAMAILSIPLTLLIWPVVSILYLAILESSPKQATFGKMLLGLKVTDSSGNRINLLKSVKRNIVKILILGIAPSFRDKITNCLVVKNSSLTNQIVDQDAYAGFFLRLAALTIDLFILGLLGALMSSIVFLLPMSLPQYDLITYLSYIVAILMVVYFSWMDSSHSQGSFGKRVVGVTITGTNGNKISFLRSLLRSFIKMFSIMSWHPIFIALALISVLSTIFSKKKQSLHDLVTRSVVVENGQNQTRINQEDFVSSSYVEKKN